MITTLRSLVTLYSFSFQYKYGIVALFVGLLSLASVQAQVSGTAYRDHNANSTDQSIPTSSTCVYGGPGVAGMATVIPATTNSLTTITIALTQAISFAL